MSPRTTPASNMYSGGYAEGHSHDYPGSRLSSTPAGSPPIPFSQLNLRLLGGDERHPDLPQRSDLIHLMEAYFDNVYSQTYAFLHRDTFMRNLDKHKPVLLFSMCAVAARFAGLRNRLHDHHKAEEIFETRARELIMKDYDKYSLEMVQSLVHMGLHDFGSNNGQKAWMFAGMAVRMGAALNMNLETNRKKEKDAITRESIRRTYWSYYLMDVCCPFSLPRAWLIWLDRGSIVTGLLGRISHKTTTAMYSFLVTSLRSMTANPSSQNIFSVRILTVQNTEQSTWGQWPILSGSGAYGGTS